MRSINVEVLTPTTFNSWTDGQKILVVDYIYLRAHSLHQVEALHGKCDGLIVASDNIVEVLSNAINQFSYKASTFYLVCDLKTFMEIEARTQNLDIRFMVF